MGIKVNMKKHKNPEKYTFILPTTLLLVILFIPIIITIVLSFFSYPLLRPDLGIKFIGLQNFERLIIDKQFINSIIKSFTFALGAVPLELFLGTLIALLLKEKAYGRNFFRVALLIPMMMTPIVVGVSWRIFLLPHFTPLAQIFEFFHIPFNAAKFLTTSKWAMVSIIVADVWQWTPFVFLMVFASLQSIPNDIYEAAKVDGATSWKQIWYLTLPLIKPSLIAIGIIRGMDAIRTFDLIYILTRGGPGFSTELVSIFNYKIAFSRYSMGYASTISTGVLILLTIAILAILKYARKEGVEI